MSLYSGSYIHGLGLTILLGYAQKTHNCVHYRSQRRSLDTRPACTIGPKGEARTFELCAPSGPYIQEVILPLVMVILGFLTIPLLGPKDTEPHVPLQYVIRSLNKGYFCLRILSRPDIQDIYCNILHKYIPLFTDQYSMRLKCYS